MLAPETAALKRAVFVITYVGQDAAVAPAADAEAVGVGDARRDHVVDRRHHVLEVLVPPVRPDRAAEGGAAARRAARVGGDHGVAVRRRGPATRARRRSRTGRRGRRGSGGWRARVWPGAWPGGSVRKPSTTVPSALVAWKRSTRPRRDRLQEVVVRAGEAAEPPPSATAEISGGCWTELSSTTTSPAGRHVEGLDVALAGDHALDRPALDAHAGEVPVAAGPRAGRARRGRRA